MTNKTPYPDDGIPVLTDKVDPSLLDRIEAISWGQLILGVLAVLMALGLLVLGLAYTKVTGAQERKIVEQRRMLIEQRQALKGYEEAVEAVSNLKADVRNLEEARARLVVCAVTGAFDQCPELQPAPTVGFSEALAEMDRRAEPSKSKQESAVVLN